MCVCVRGVHTCDKRELQVFRRCHSAIPCLFVKDSLSFPQNLQSKLGWLASKPQRPTCLYYNAHTDSLIFLPVFLRTEHGSCCFVASTFLAKPVPRPLHWKFGYPERFGVGVNLPRHTHLSWQFCPARVALPKSHGFPCELTFNVQSLGKSQDGAAVIIHTAEGKENDLYCKKWNPFQLVYNLNLNCLLKPFFSQSWIKFPPQEFPF